MVPPVQVSPLIKTARWSALLAGLIYGKRRYGDSYRDSPPLEQLRVKCLAITSDNHFTFTFSLKKKKKRYDPPVNVCML
uniref:ATP synthase F(0) complex subunit e, mitochondrial n=1 Tax=Denticeps clupeoides TaxID=299321 RepID=A0AAY4CJT2_9TELE